MKFQPFELERWLSTHSGQYNFAGVNPPPVKLGELIEKIDPETMLVYGSTRGSNEVREAISHLYSEVSPDEVLVTNGTAEANFLVASSLLVEGDEFLLVTPNYLQTLGIAQAAGAKVKFSRLREDDGFRLNLEEITENVSSKTKAVFVTNPNNPTGATLSESEVRGICEVAEDVGAYVIFDEVIRGLELNGVVSVSPVDIYERGISTASVSKLGLLGLRLGWIAACKEVVERCWNYKDYTTLSHSGLSEWLATLALQGGKLQWLRERARSIFKRNSVILLDWIKESAHELSCVPPRAGGSVFPRYKVDLDSRYVCEELLRQEGILLSPGDFFGANNHFRLRYGGHDEQTLSYVLSRLTDFLRNLRQKHAVA